MQNTRIYYMKQLAVEMMKSNPRQTSREVARKTGLTKQVIDHIRRKNSTCIKKGDLYE